MLFLLKNTFKASSYELLSKIKFVVLCAKFKGYEDVKEPQKNKK